MKNYMFACLILLCSITDSNAQQLSHSVMTIGNISDVQNIEAYATDLLQILDSLDHRHTLIFNGDLDLKTLNFRQTSRRLDTLINILRDEEQRKLIFIPGDRDWDYSGPLGWERVQLLEDYIRDKKLPDVQWPLKNGCPGPEKINLGLTLNLIAVNTQWWNHPHNKPMPESASCNIATSEGAMEEMRNLIDETRFGNLIIAGHYPIQSNGEFGGKFPLRKWLLPVPVVSSMVTSFRQNVGSAYEIANHRFAEFREPVEDLMREYSSVIYMSGHEHHTEILKYYDNVLINAGAPEQGKYVTRSRETLMATNEPSALIVHYDLEGDVWGVRYAYANRQFSQGEPVILMQAPCAAPLPHVPVNERLIPCLEEEYVLLEMSRTHPADTQIVANPDYQAKSLKRTFLGEHYRQSWTAPVIVPVLNLDDVKGGLTPYQVGGGRQTKSLKMLSDNGEEYVFRSVDKDPSKALSYDLRETLISLAIQDQTTTQQPYGALVASRMLDHLDILHATPDLYAMPVDEKLGPFKAQYGGMLGMLEERPTGRKEAQHTFADADEIKRSVSMFRFLYEDGDNVINVDEFLRARVFDILVGDWGKHEDNWKWAGYKDGINMEFRPIPRDRDHVFSRWDGVLPWLADREWAKPSGENFDYKIKGLRSLMWQARHLDRFLASEATGEQWAEAAREVQTKITDEVIDNAVSALPDASEAIDGDILRAKLQARRADLLQYAERYYRMIARQVDVVGSVKSELFEVTRLEDGRVLVEMFKLKKGAKDKRFYSRTFDQGVTEEIRLYGLRGDDKFEINGNANTSILVRVVPGLGKDVIEDASQVAKGPKSTRVYDLNATDHVTGGPELKMVDIPHTGAYSYSRTAFKYQTYFPYGFVMFSSANGVQVAAGSNFTRHNYDKPDFSSRHAVMLRASTLGNLHFGYDGRWRHVAGQWDLTAGISFDERQRFNYFFGYGNATEIDKDLFRDRYYSLQFSNVQAEVGLIQQFWSRSHFSTSIEVMSTGGEKSDSSIFDTVDPSTPGVDGLRTGKLRAQLDLDFRNRIHLPTRGMRLLVEGYYAELLNQRGDYSLLSTTLEAFTTVKPFTLGIKAGAALHGGEPPYFDQYYLGQITHLRGYRENRFAGKKTVFFNSDLRIQLVDKANGLLPHKIGITLFYDVGRVDIPGESTDIWHYGYGAGIYYVPLRERFALQLSAAFSEEESGLIRLTFGQSF